MAKVTILAEGKAYFRKTIELPDAEAKEFAEADDATVLCNIDEADDIDEITGMEVLDVHVST